MTSKVTVDLLIDQWRNSRSVSSLVQAFLDRVKVEVEDALNDLERMLNLDHAEGVWLDRIGERLGVTRPQVQYSGDRFAFEGAGHSFDQAPFSGSQEHADIVPMSDEPFRKILKARIVALFSDGTKYALQCSICGIDPEAQLVERGPMRLRVTTGMVELMQVADRLGALARTAGVEVAYKDRGRFGFEDAGVSFDQGPYDVA